MKKILLSLNAIVFAINISYAQYWAGGPTGPISYNGGNVGIGTSSPGQKLAVNGSFSSMASFSSYTTDGLFSANALPCFITTPSGPPGILFGYSDAGGGQYVPRIGFSAPFSLGHQVATQASIGLEPVNGDLTIHGGAYNTEQLRILNTNGNVGIGTTSPGVKLHVAYSNSSASIGSVSDGVVFQNTNTTSGALNSLFFANSGGFASAAISVIQTQTGNDGDNLILQAKAHTGAWNASQLLLNTNGNVGIGTANPDQKLTVKGTIHSQEVIVDVSFLPDYVFKPTYHLPTLNEVKTYIDQNHHLPEMPSAGQVEKNGLSLGDMNAKLLKKVEELTLYMIELKKDNDELKTDNTALRRTQQKINQKLKLHNIN